MQLKSFRVLNYRSINDSGDIDVSRITALLGRNESGKSNLLRALESLNPADGFEALNPIKDFPRHRKLSECSDHTNILETTWALLGAAAGMINVEAHCLARQEKESVSGREMADLCRHKHHARFLPDARRECGPAD